MDANDLIAKLQSFVYVLRREQREKVLAALTVSLLALAEYVRREWTVFPQAAYLTVMGNLFGKEFKRNETTEVGVLSFVHNPHPTTAQPLDDAIVRDGLPNELGGFAHWREC